MDNNPGEFVFSFPVWFIRMPEAQGVGIAGATLSEGRRCVYAFTDLDLAERFIAERANDSQPGLATSIVADAEHFKRLMGGLRKDGVTHVVFDSRFPVRIESLA
jgi:hypothetical protein